MSDNGVRNCLLGSDKHI